MREFSTQNKLERVRAPRVEIAYDVETGGAIERKELPFVMGVMADLSGRSESPLAPLTDYRRKFIEIDWDNFSDVMKGMAPRLAYQVENTLSLGAGGIGVELRFACLDDFSPESVANQVESLKKLVEVRTDLQALLAKTDGNDGLADKLQDILHNSDLQQSIREGSVVASNTTASGKAGVNGNKEKQATTEAGAQEASVFDQILTQINIGKSEWDRDQSRRQISTLVDEAMQGKLRVSTDVEQTIDARIKDIDRALTDQLNAIMHAHDFQRLESAWRGLHYLVRQTESSSRIRIRVLNVSKGELLKDFERAVEFDQSALFRKVYEEEYGTFGGAPYGALIGDYEFGNQPQDVSLLEKISNVAAAAHAPFLAAASPTLLGLQSFTELPHPRDLAKILATPEHACWQSFRTSEDSRYVGLALPRILLRLPYGPATNPVEAFNFMEEVSGGNQEHYLWGNAAYALGSCLTNAFAKYSWCAAQYEAWRAEAV